MKASNLFYMPCTASPFKQNETYREVLPLHPALTGIIRCFWGSDRPYLRDGGNAMPTLVVPDTCVDIIYQIDYTENSVAGYFCGVNDTSFVNREEAEDGHLVSVFAIRFYAWEAWAFSEDSLKGTINSLYDVQSRFSWLDKALRPQLFFSHSLKERAGLAEELFLKRLFLARQNDTVSCAISQILAKKGRLGADGLSRSCFISSRQLERLFHEFMGIPPKKLCNLVRYQYLWNEILRNPGFRVQDAVYRYGYTDQSHLMREFKRYHTMDIKNALAYAQGTPPCLWRGMSEIYNIFPRVCDKIKRQLPARAGGILNIHNSEGEDKPWEMMLHYSVYAGQTAAPATVTNPCVKAATRQAERFSTCRKGRRVPSMTVL